MILLWSFKQSENVHNSPQNERFIQMKSEEITIVLSLESATDSNKPLIHTQQVKRTSLAPLQDAISPGAMQR
jgi:hypothetical protein